MNNTGTKKGSITK